MKWLNKYEEGGNVPSKDGGGEDFNSLINKYNFTKRKLDKSRQDYSIMGNEVFNNNTKYQSFSKTIQHASKPSDLLSESDNFSVKEVSDKITPFMIRKNLNNKYYEELYDYEDKILNTNEGKRIQNFIQKINTSEFLPMTVSSDKSSYMTIGDDIKYPVAGYMRNAKFTKNAIESIKTAAKKRGIDPNILAASLAIESNGEVRTDKYYNTHNVNIKEIERMGIPVSETIGFMKGFDNIIPIAKQAGAYMKDGSINTKRLMSYIHQKDKQLDELEPLDNTIDAHAYYIKRNGLKAINPKQKTLPGVKHGIDEMINAGADIIRQKKIFDAGGKINWMDKY